MTNSNMGPDEKQGLFLINLGTPDGPTPPEVKKYLKEFLMDPRVIDIPFVFRWILVTSLLSKRSVTSAEAYSKIWTNEGSPLLTNLLGLTTQVQNRLGSRWVVKSGMRYQSPPLAKALAEFKEAGIHNVIVLPLYPQYSLAATESSFEACRNWVSKNAPMMKLRLIQDFYDDPEFIQAFSDIAQRALKEFRYDHLLFSFHGLPERQIKKLSPDTREFCRFDSACCEQIQTKNRKCYRAQCFATAKGIAQSLQLSPSKYTICFQSRLGRTPWIQPYTDELYQKLPAQGVRRLAVMCPAFTSDCLETLEEVAIRGRQDFIRNGGEDLRLIPSLNQSEGWVSAICSWAKKWEAA